MKLSHLYRQTLKVIISVMTSDTPRTRARREEHHLIQDLPAHFEFTAFGERHQMTVKPNTGLLAPGFFMQVYGDNSTVQTDFEVTLCHYVGNLTSHSAPSHVAISNCKGLVSTLKQPTRFMHIILCMCECIVLEPIWVVVDTTIYSHITKVLLQYFLYLFRH